MAIASAAPAEGRAPEVTSPITNKKGKPFRASHSTFETFNDCTLKGYYNKYLCLPQKDKPSSTLGSAVHDVLEEWFNAGACYPLPEDTPRRVRQLAEVGMPYVPWNTHSMPPKERWHAETWASAQCGPLPFVAKVDLWAAPLGPAVQPHRLVISDYKTSSDPWRWGKGPEELANFTQPLVYAYALQQTHGWVAPETFDAQHIYMKTRGKAEGFEVWARDIPWSRVEKRWEKLTRKAERIVDMLASDPKPEDVPYNTKSCRKYGGCDYADICPRNPANAKAVSHPRTPTIGRYALPEKAMSIFDRLNAMQADQAAKNTPAAEPAAEPPANEAPRMSVDEALKQLHDNADAPEAVKEQIAAQCGKSLADLRLHCRYDADKHAAQPTPAADEDDAEAAMTVLVEALARALHRQGSIGVGDFKEAIRDHLGVKRVSKTLMRKVVAFGQHAFPDWFLTDAFTLLPRDPHAPVENPTPDTDTDTEEDRRIAEVVTRPAMVFVGCMPMVPETPVVSLSEVLRDFTAQVAEQHGVGHYSQVDYGKGKTAVLGLLRRALYEHGLETLTGGADLFVDNHHPLKGDVIDVLRAAGVTGIVRTVS